MSHDTEYSAQHYFLICVLVLLQGCLFQGPILTLWLLHHHVDHLGATILYSAHTTTHYLNNSSYIVSYGSYMVLGWWISFTWRASVCTVILLISMPYYYKYRNWVILYYVVVVLNRSPDHSVSYQIALWCVSYMAPFWQDSLSKISLFPYLYPSS